jgi:hypothetical protein
LGAGKGDALEGARRLAGRGHRKTAHLTEFSIKTGPSQRENRHVKARVEGR